MRRGATEGTPFWPCSLLFFSSSPSLPPVFSQPWRNKTTHWGRLWSMQSLFLLRTHTKSRSHTHTHTRPDVGDKWGRDVLWLGQSGSKCKCVRWNMPANGRTISQAAERTDSLASGTITSGDLGLSQLLSLSLSTFPSFPFPPLLPLAPSSFRWAEAKRR